MIGEGIRIIVLIMGRKKRIWYPGAIYHVMSRGNHQAALFKDNADYLHFLDIIKEARDYYHFKLHSLCLMTNHFHMVIETAGDELWRIMQRILHKYCMDFNSKYNLKGHLFESRYTASIIETDKYFMEVSRYIHLNPVKACMVKRAIDYEYSSYRQFIHTQSYYNTGPAEKVLSELIDTSRVLEYFGYDSREEYRKFVEGKISHEEQENLIRKEMRENDLWLPR